MLKKMFRGTSVLLGLLEGTNREGEKEGRREKAPTLIEVFARASCVISIFGSLQRDFPAFKERTFAGLHRLTASL